MKLLLTSAGWWKEPSIGREFVELVDKKPSSVKIFFVTTPDYKRKDKYILRMFRQFRGVKIPKENVTFFQFEREIKKGELKNFDVVFVFGGNTFDYLDSLRKTGLDKEIKTFVKKGGVYMGLSAGSYVACPTIEAALWKHPDRNVLGLKDLRGLNLVPFLISAHFDDEVCEAVTKAALKSKYPTIAITDKQAILVKGRQVKIVGKGEKVTFNSSKKY